MNILSVSHYYPPHVGGLEVVAQKQVESLVSQGHAVSVVTCAIKNAPRGKVVDGCVTVHRERVWNVLDQYFGIPFPIPGVGIILRIFNEVKRAGAVHIHDVFYATSWLAALCALVFHKPIILTQHVALVEHPSAIVMAVQRLVYRSIGRLIFQKAHTIVVYNTNVRAFLQKQGVDMEKVIGLRNGIDLSLFTADDATDVETIRRSFGLPTGVPIALFVGRFVPKKGFDILYAARSERYHIVFAGTGNIPAEWKDDPRVSFVGPLTHDELAKLYRAVDVFVFPAVGEIFTLVMQEAMASGLPIITTDDPGYREYPVDRNLIRFVHPDSESLARAITEVLSDRPLARRMRAYSITLAKEWFDWGRNIHPILDLYSMISTKSHA